MRTSGLAEPGNPQTRLARFAADLEWSALPAEVREASRALLLDTVAVTLAGSAAPGVSGVLDTLREWGGAPQACVAVFGDRLPAPAAAMANATMAHALDYDDKIGRASCRERG